MATSSDQIQADIARTRAEMAARLDRPRPYASTRSYTGTQPSLGGGGIAEQVRQRPLLALGLTLVAGSLLQNYLGGQQSQSSAPRYQPTGRPYGTPQASGAYRRVEGSVRQATHAVGDVAQSAGQAVASTASQVVDTARDAATSVVDTTVDTAQRVADTAGDVAYRVADTAGDVAYQVAETAGDVTEEVTERVGDLASTVTNFVSERPLVALGLSLAAGSLLQQYLSGGLTSTRQTYTGYRPSYPDYQLDYGTVPGADAYTGTGARVGQAARGAADAVGDAAQGVGHAASDVTRRAVDTTVDAASSVVDTATDVAQRAGNVAVDAVDQVVDTAGNAMGQVAETVGDIWPAATRQVQERPLTALAVAIAAGMLLQPTLSPHVSALTTDVRDFARTVSGGVGEVVSLPEPPEVQRIKDAIVPATVDRTRQLLNREVRDYLDRSLEGLVGQASLRAGVVAAVTEQAENLVDRRLANLLNGLSGTPGLLVLGLTGAVLEARNQAQQGQGQTITNVRTQLSQSIVQNAQEQLSRYFPEFRAQLQSQENSAQHCTSCGSQLTPNARFCPSCGTPVPAGGTSV